MKTVLSIQSHVAFGHVGNRAAVFPLERLGCAAIPVNTVQFSNHTGYGTWTGQVFAPAHVAEIVAGIEARGGLAACDAVLTGYLGDVALGDVVLDALARVRAAKAGAMYCCDPVMGDVGRGFFVRPGLPEFFRDRATPAAEIMTPNQFELEFLTGQAVTTLEEALAATALLRARGPRIVLVTSLVRTATDPESIEMLLDTADGSWLVATPRLALDPQPNGAGDCVAALFLARLLQSQDPAGALAHAAAAIHAVFAATAAAGTRELQIVAAQDALVRPPRCFPPVKVA